MMNDEVSRFQGQVRAFLRRMRSEQPLIDGLSRGSVRILHVISRAGGSTTGRGRRTSRAWPSSNVAPILRELEAAGFVLRERDRDDAGRVRVILTERGRDACERSREGRDEWLRETMAKTLDAEERALVFAAGDLLERMTLAEPSPSRRAEGARRMSDIRGGMMARAGAVRRTPVGAADASVQRALNAQAPSIPHLGRRIVELFRPHTVALVLDGDPRPHRRGTLGRSPLLTQSLFDDALFPSSGGVVMRSCSSSRAR